MRQPTRDIAQNGGSCALAADQRRSRSVIRLSPRAALDRRIGAAAGRAVRAASRMHKIRFCEILGVSGDRAGVRAHGVGAYRWRHFLPRGKDVMSASTCRLVSYRISLVSLTPFPTATTVYFRPPTTAGTSGVVLPLET